MDNLSLPASEQAIRIAKLFRRRRTTHWSEKEVRVIRKLTKTKTFADLEDLALVELYYEFERKKGDKGIHRRDLFTFLNNYRGEVDRAHLWAEKFPALATKANGSRQPKPQPARWAEFLTAVYPEARERDFWRAPTSVQEEYRRWEKAK